MFLRFFKLRFHCPKMSRYFKSGFFDKIFIKKAVTLHAVVNCTELPCCELSVELPPAVDAVEECPFESTLCYLISGSSNEFTSEAESQTEWKSAAGEAAAVICAYKSLPVCLFLRWLIRGAELGVGLFPLGRNRAAPFTVRKLSLILEGKRKEKDINRRLKHRDFCQVI